MEHKLLDLAKKVSAVFPKYYLAGGTAIMLKHQHRQSYDLDFFNKKWFSFRHLAKKMRENFNISKEEHHEDNIDLIVDNIKVSFVFFPFENILKIEKYQGIRIASDYDLFLNKIYVGGRRIDKRDPFDAASLYKKYQWPINQVKKDFDNKFPDQSFEFALGALANSEDYPDLAKWTKEVLSEMINQIN